MYKGTINNKLSEKGVFHLTSSRCCMHCMIGCAEHPWIGYHVMAL